MKHFDNVQWKAYMLNQVSEKQREEMEDHLLECADCMQVYFSIAEENLPSEAVISINSSVMNQIQQDRHNSRLKIFKYYVAAASVTIFLTATGSFDYFTKSVPKMSYQIAAVPQRALEQWSVKSLNINLLKFNDFKGGVWK